MRRMAILALIPLFSAPVAAQEAGDPQAGAAYAKQYCAKCHAIADEDASPEQTAPRFKDVANSSGMTATALTVWLQTSHPTMRTPARIFVRPRSAAWQRIAFATLQRLLASRAARCRL